MKVRIISSDGTGRNTKVVDEQTGEVIEGIRGISLDVQPNEPIEATISMIFPPVELKRVEAKIKDIIDVIESDDKVVHTAIEVDWKGYIQIPAEKWEMLKSLIRDKIKKEHEDG